MWRSFNRGTVGVALIINVPKVDLANPSWGVVLAKVKYLTGQQLTQELDALIQRLENAKQTIDSYSPQVIAAFIYAALLMFTVATKHPGFKEEREWRVLRLPSAPNSSPILSPGIEVVSGVPQSIYKLDFKNVPANNISGMSLEELLYQLVIGPTQYEDTVRATLVSILKRKGLSRAEQRVTISGMPFRS